MTQEHMTVVVDGGGSGCSLAVFDANGTILARAVDGPASLSLGVGQTWQHICRGLQSLAVQMGQPNDWLPAQLCMGLSGALQSERRRDFLALLPAVVKVTLITDGQAQLMGVTGGQPGICLAIGTGTVLHWIDTTGAIRLAGGWGFPMGDEGSGAWLGARLINSYLWHRDTGCRDMPAVFRALEARIGTSASDIQIWSTCKRSTELASLVPLIGAAAKGGDPVALSLLQAGAGECARLLALAPKNLPIHVVGGLSSTYCPLFSAPVRARICPSRGDIFTGLYKLSQNPQRYIS